MHNMQRAFKTSGFWVSPYVSLLGLARRCREDLSRQLYQNVYTRKFDKICWEWHTTAIGGTNWFSFLPFYFPLARWSPSVFGPGDAGQIKPVGGQVRVPPPYLRVQALRGRLVPLESNAKLKNTFIARTNSTFPGTGFT